MKQLLTILMTVMTMLGATAQTRSLATLLHDGKLTFYDKVTSLEDAISAAVDGDTIYLSEGKFGASSDSITILNKKISIVGAGYGSDIKPHIHFLFKDYQGEDNVLKAPLFDGVKLGTLIFNSSAYCDTIVGINLKKCRIAYLYLWNSTNDVNIDRCWIDNYFSLRNKNTNISNSKIQTFDGNNIEVIEHCYINEIKFDGYYTLNSLISKYSVTTNQNKCIYENCIMPELSHTGSTGNRFSQQINCWSYIIKFDEYMDTDFLESASLPYSVRSTDGTKLGVSGGEQPFSENPTVPTVDSSRSSVEYDKDSNQLNVTITVVPN